MSVRLLVLRHVDDGTRRAYPRAVNRLELYPVTVEVEQRELFSQRACVRARGDERAERHVAADASEAVEVECAHLTVSLKFVSKIQCAVRPRPRGRAVSRHTRLRAASARG